MADPRRASTLVQKAESLVGRLVGLNDATAAVEICEALASCLEGAQPGTVDDTLALEAGRLATVRHPNKPAVLLSVGRLYLASGLLERAYRALADGLQGGAKGYRPYRLLGEALLRLGDAQLAMPMFKRALLEGDDDPDTGAWYACAKAYVAMQESQGSDAVARDVERRRRPEKPQEREPSLPRFPSLLDCSEISNMVTNRVAAKKLPRAQPPPLPQERTRSDAPCTVSLDEPAPERRDPPPIDLIDEESSGERAETVKLQAKQVLEKIAKVVVKPPPLPPDSRAKPSAKPPPLPVTPPSRPVSAAPPPKSAASESQKKSAGAASNAPPAASESQTKSAVAASNAPPASSPAPAAPSIVPPPLPSVAPTAKAASVSPSNVNQALWEAEVTPRHLPTPSAKGARRPFRHWKWVQAAALVLGGAAFGFFGGKVLGRFSAESEAARASQAAPAEAAVTSAAIASAAEPAQRHPASNEPAAGGTAAASASAAAAANARKAPAFDPFSPVGRLYSTTDAAVIVAGVPVAAVVSPAVAAGKRALATRPSLARPGGRVWP